MAYKTNNSMKSERKQGIDAMRAMVNAPGFDPQAALALAQQNLDAFGKLDDLGNAEFIHCMEDMRKNHPNLYQVFWWWRDSEEKAGRRQEMDSDQPETKYRTFMVTQFLQAPFSADWEDDRRTLKPGVDPWITEEQIAKGLDHASIKRWAWVWHDRDIYTEQDEIADRNNQVKAGELKFKHAHIVMYIPAKVPISTIARWFNVPPQQVTVLRGRGAFLDGVEYLPHESPRAVEQFKTHYDDDEIHVSPGFDFRKELTDLQGHRAKYGKRSGDMTPADTMRMHVMHDGWSMKMCRDDDPLTYAKIRNSLPPLRLDYLLDADPCPFRMNIYVDGPGGIGKSSFCEYIAQAMFQGAEDSYFTIGNDERVTFDGYDGQPAIIWDDVRVTDFIRQFGGNGAFRILDPHPKKIAQQAKHSRLILTNVVNIINGVQPYDEFIAVLAGTYTDRDGVQHKAEDENQAWRRFPLILCVRPDDFSVLVNQGVVDNDLSSVKAMHTYARVRGSLKSAMQKLDGMAKEKALVTFGDPVLSARKMIEESHDKKITDPDQIPPELMPEVIYCAGNLEQARLDEETRVKDLLYDKVVEQGTKYEESRVQTLIEFGRWFWSSVSGGFAHYLEKHPEDLDNPCADMMLAEDDAELWPAIAYCLPYFKRHMEFYMEDFQVKDGQVVTTGHHTVDSYELVTSFSQDELLDTVKVAHDGYFGDIPPLSKAYGYKDWLERAFDRKPERGHKICPDCHKNSVFDAGFCQHCGKPLPGRVYYGDGTFDRARIWLANERGCKLEDVPEEDVKARALHADGSDMY